MIYSNPCSIKHFAKILMEIKSRMRSGSRAKDRDLKKRLVIMGCPSLNLGKNNDGTRFSTVTRKGKVCDVSQRKEKHSIR